MSRSKKRKFHNRTVTVVCVILAFVMIITGVIAIAPAVGDYTSTVSTDTAKSDQILKNARAKLEANNSYMLYIEGYQNEHSADDKSTPLYFAYQIAGSKDKSDRSYSYLSTSGGFDNEYWYYDEETEVYMDYIYSDDIDEWVLCDLDYEPVIVNPFAVLDDMSEFTLLSETAKFGTNEDECYIYQLAGTSEEYEIVYERIYIGVEDYMLKGAIRMAMHDNDEQIEVTMDDLTVQELYEEKGVEFDENNKAEITTTTADSEEVIFRFEYYFSNADMLFIDKPKVYITADEYAIKMGLEADKENGEDS